jgi:hypothetical protein
VLEETRAINPHDIRGAGSDTRAYLPIPQSDNL